MMKLISGGIIYLALVFHLGTGAVVNVEQKLSEETNIAVKAILEELTEKINFDRMFDHNVADIDTENKQLTIGSMSCSWSGNIGKCCTHLYYIERLCVRFSIVGTGIFIEASRNGNTFKQRFLKGSGTMTFEYSHHYLHLTLTVSVVRSSQEIKSCFKINYSVGFRRYSNNLRCNKKRWHSNENRPVKNLSPNIKSLSELEGFDFGQIYRNGYLDVIADGRSLSEEMVKENNVVNMDSQNEQSVTKGSEIGDLQMKILKCNWKKKAGHCSILLDNLPWLYVNMTVVPTGIHFHLQLGVRPLLDTDIHGVLTKTLNISLGPAQLWLEISVKNNTSHYIKVCFFLKYKVLFRSWSRSLGCPSKSFPTREEENNTLMSSMKDLNKNFQHPLRVQDSDPDMVFGVVQNAVEENQFEKAFHFVRG
ncbi:Hypothetical predicted protein [Octopus vulgaris]|uniref:Uncharacterized protein n=1 Tax=Octopus vulgaris TaxID=6645 RepID=A0AA36BCV3_OCTVU|nr:Hypothetical predicted protein [Octopus vulgaris]